MSQYKPTPTISFSGLNVLQEGIRSRQPSNFRSRRRSSTSSLEHLIAILAASVKSKYGITSGLSTPANEVLEEALTSIHDLRISPTTGSQCVRIAWKINYKGDSMVE